MKTSISNMFKVAAFFGIFLCFDVINCEQILQNFKGEVGAGNYTYFTLQREGEITLILDSTEGDADIYISEHVTKPDFENYDLQSTTCGRDIVTVPKHYKRPIGIAVFGHIHSPISKYVMTVVIDYSNGNDYYSVSQEKSHWLSSEDENDAKEESVIWMVFVSIIKIVFEILV